MDNKLLLTLSTIFLVAGTAYLFNTTNGPQSLQMVDTTHPLFNHFAQWKDRHGRRYGSAEEEQYRFGLFIEKFRHIQAHNADNTKTYRKGLNQFSDLSKEEFRATYLGVKGGEQQQPSKKQEEQQEKSEVNRRLTQQTGTVFWQDNIPAVQNQGACGSCWAFSSTESTAAIWSITTQTPPVTLSAQQLVSCSQMEGTYGCQGTPSISYGLNFIQQYNVTTLANYPYFSGNGWTYPCYEMGGNYTISGYNNITDCTTLQQALYTQPITVGVAAENWDDYAGGVYPATDCENQTSDHAVFLVGYNATSDVWIVENSWGTTWGIDGFIELQFGDTCNICQTAFQPLLNLP